MNPTKDSPHSQIVTGRSRGFLGKTQALWEITYLLSISHTRMSLNCLVVQRIRRFPAPVNPCSRLPYQGTSRERASPVWHELTVYLQARNCNLMRVLRTPASNS